ncbi:MAG: hypothetical protein HYX27_08940 [Acidobacteria bacterium]|nr:hypothetical protein [Acidobacteriota bacterium]
MPSKTLLLCAGIGLLIVGVLISGGLLATRGTHLTLDGSIRKTRTAGLSATRSVIVLDFRATNPADYPFVVKTVEVEITLADGRRAIGQFIPEVDAKLLFPALPALGEKLVPSIATGEKIAKKQTVERMAAASFEAPESDIAARKGVVLRLRDADGPVAELR